MKLYLDTEVNQIFDSRGHKIKKLSSAESNLLAEFIRERGKCLSREHLMNAGWPKACVVDNALNMAIRKLRATGINIETIARNGYVLADDSVMFASKDHLYPTKVESLSASEETVRDLSEEISLNLNERGVGELSLSQQYIRQKIKKRKYKNNKLLISFLFIYILGLSFFYFILEGAKPDIRCFEKKSVKVCTTYSAFDENLLETLSPGVYIYGKTYDESNERKFIAIKI